MKKIFPAVSALVIIIMMASVFVLADEGDFIITNGVLTEYKGTASDVTIPESVTRIQSGAFKSGIVKSITITFKSCTIDSGAFPVGATIYGYSDSTAETAANASGNKFVSLDASVHHTLTVNYVYSDGEKAAVAYSQSVEENTSYSVNSPNISGYTADKTNISGTMGTSDITVTVVYNKNIDSGWKIEGRYIKYYDSSISSYLTNTTKAIDGINRSFDSFGNLMLSDDFVTVGSSTYYLVNNVIFSGYIKIGNGIYCFDSSGAMVKNASQDGYTFDSDGRMSSSRQLITLSGATYYLIDNSLFSGYCLIDDNIYYFGSDYAMVSGGTFDGYTFDSNGHLTSGIAASGLDVQYTPSLDFNGMEQKPSVEVYFMGLKLVEGVHYTVSYSNNITPGTGNIIITGLSPVSGTSEWNFEIIGKDSYMLTINYEDSEGRKVAETYTSELKPGEDYYVVSPEIDGYKVSRDIVSGTMGYEDVSITVTYKAVANGNDSDTGSTDSDTDSNEKEYDKKVRVTYSYNYKLWTVVVIISTVIAGGAIVVVIKNKQIKQAIGRLFSKKGKFDEEKSGGHQEQSNEILSAGSHEGKAEANTAIYTGEKSEKADDSASVKKPKRFYYKKK